jgi:translocation and assembly module TamB
MTKSAVAFSRTLSGFLAILLTILLLLQIAFFSGCLWLGTQNGVYWAEKTINMFTAPHGVFLRFSRIGYQTEKGFYIEDLILAKSDGLMIEADDLSVNMAFLPLLAKHLSAKVDAGTITIHAPIALDENDSEKSSSLNFEGFVLPDFFIKSLTLNGSRIERLYLPTQKGEEQIILSPILQGNIIRNGNDLSWSTRLLIHQSSGKDGTIPELFSSQGTFSTRPLAFSIDHFRIKSDLYDINGTLTATSPSFGQGNIQAIFTSLTEKGLSPINISFETNNNDGHLSVTSAYRNAPISLRTPLFIDDTKVELSNIILDMPPFSASGEMEINRSTFLANGKISINFSDIGNYADLFNAELKGSGNAEVIFSENQDKQSIHLTSLITDLKYSDISAERLRADLHIPDISLLTPDDLSLNIKNLYVDDHTQMNELRASLTPQDDHYLLNIVGRGRNRTPFAVDASADLYDTLTKSPSARKINTTLSAGHRKLSIRGMLNTQSIDIEARTDNFPLDWAPLGPTDVFSRLSLSGILRLYGSLDTPVAAANLSVSGSYADNRQSRIETTIKGEYKDKKLALSMRGTGDGIETLDGDITLPMNLSLRPPIFELANTAPLNGSIMASAQSGKLASLFLPPVHSVDGMLKACAAISGTLSTPDVNGTLSLTQGHYRYEPYDISLNDVSLLGTLSGTQVTLTSLSAHDGEQGTLKGHGYYNLNGDGALNFTVDQYHLLRGEIADGIIDGDLTMAASRHRFNIDGDINLGPLTVVIPEKFSTTIPELNIVTPGEQKNTIDILENIALNINVHAQRFFVRGWGLDAEFDGGVRIDGTLADPKFNGAMSTTRGRYEEFGKRFDLVKANLRFQGNIPPSPYLDIEASTRAGDVTASVLMSGPATKPSINFSSSPALPEDEVLAYILFGRSMNRVTPFQAVQLTQTLRRLSGEGGGSRFDPLSTLRSLTGLDDIRVDTNDDGETSVGAGKYLTDDVYLEVEGGSGEESGAATLQIELTPNVTVESEVGQDARAGGGILWRYDY